MTTLSDHTQLFDRFALGYYVVDLLSFGLSNYLRKEALRKTPVSTNSHVIDLMCGTGNNAKYLLDESYKNLTYTGIDSSEKMIEQATHFYAPANHSHKFSFIKADVFSPLNVADKPAHLFCSYGLKCISTRDYRAFVNNIDNLLSEKGTVSLVEFQLPAPSVFRFLFKTYLKTIYRLGCLLITGSMRPAYALLDCIAQPIDQQQLKHLFQEKGFEIVIEEKWMRSVVFIYGKKLR